MNDSVSSFVKAAVRNVVGPIQGINAQQTRLELFSVGETAQQLACVVEAVRGGEGIRATITQPAKDVEKITVTGAHFEAVTQSVFDRLPEGIFACARIDARFTGVAQDGAALQSATGSSVHGNIFVNNSTDTALDTQGCVTGEASVAGIITTAVNAAVDHITSRKGDAARICLTTENGGASSIWWVLFTARDGVIYARTNDADPFSAPALSVVSPEAQEIKTCTVEALNPLLANKGRLTVRVFRDESRVGYLAVLEGSSDDGALRPQPEFPSL